MPRVSTLTVLLKRQVRSKFDQNQTNLINPYLFKVHFVRMYLLKGIYLADGVAITEAVVVVPPGSKSHHEVSTSKIN